MPSSSATRLVDWLVRANFVERIDDPGDRRIVRVRLTAIGKQVHLTTLNHNKQQIMHLLSLFSLDEQEQLLRLIYKLSHSLLAERAIKQSL